MQSQPVTETVTLSDDLNEINRKADGALIGYRLKVRDEHGDFCPSITCWRTIGEERVANPAFERLEEMKDKLTKGARMWGLVYNMYYSKKQEGVEVILVGHGDVIEKAHLED